jgi:hypothetical protein
MTLGLLKSTLPLYCLLLGLFPLGARASDDTSTVKMLAAAQKTLMEAFPSGSLTATVDDQYVGRKATATVIWQGNRYFCDALTEEFSPSASRPTTKVRFVYIRKNNRWDYYFPDSALLQRIADGRASGWEQLRLAPEEQWFQMNFAGPTTFLAQMQRLLKPDSDFTYTTHDSGDGLIRLEAQHNSNWDRAITVFSMKHGGAVLSHEVIPIDSKALVRSRTLYTWLPATNGIPRLESYKYQQTAATDANFQDERAVTITINEFDTNRKIASDRFEISSLALPEGTWVEELGANERRYRIGDNSRPAPGISEQTFRDLAVELSRSKLGRTSQ